MVETCIAVTYNARQILRELKLKMNANSMSEVIVNLSRLYNQPEPKPIAKPICSATLEHCYVCGMNLPSDCTFMVAGKHLCPDCYDKFQKQETGG